MKIYHQFRSLLSPRRYLQTRDKVSCPVGKTIGPRQWVIARGLCLCRVFMLGGIPSGERKNALNVRIRQWSPFMETGHYVTWREEAAHVWIWDDAVRRNGEKDVGANASRVFPETLLQSPPDGNTLRIVSCMEGIEAQIWEHGDILASHWWADMPRPGEWKRFLVAHDLDPASDIPVPEDIPWLNRPWARMAGGNSSQNSRYEPWVAAAMAMLLFFLIWQGISVWRWNQAGKALNARINALTQEAEPLLKARTQATKDKQLAERLISLVEHPAQLELMAEVAKKLPSGEVFLAEWRYNQRKLTFTLQGRNLDPRYYVETCQKSPYFREVTAERGRRTDQLMVRMGVRD